MTEKLGNPFKISELIETVNNLVDTTVDDSNLVHKTGNETIGGRKTYTNSYLQKNTALTKGTLPSSANWWVNEYTDKNGSGLNNRLACMEYAISTNGDVYTHLRTYKYASNNSDNATLSIVYPITGNPFATAPTPTTTTSTDSTQIATTGWVNSIDNNIVHKTGNETIGGDKTFNNDVHFNNGVFVDAAYGVEGGQIEFAKAPNSSLTGTIKLDVYKNSMRMFGPDSNGNNRVVIEADIEDNALYIPASDKINSAVSTTGINKAQDGYVKFGNGLIIQWGFSNTSGSTTVTFPTAFTSTNYVAVGNSTGGSYVVINRNSQSTTSMTMSNTVSFEWIAIGY